MWENPAEGQKGGPGVNLGPRRPPSEVGGEESPSLLGRLTRGPDCRGFGWLSDEEIALVAETTWPPGAPPQEKAKRAGIHLPFGALGENLLLDLDPHLLPPGARLRVGEALLELTQVCTVCNSLSQFDLRLPKLLYGGRGLYARVLEGGRVRVGDLVLVAAE
jgi:hypothetical protein